MNNAFTRFAPFAAAAAFHLVLLFGLAFTPKPAAAGKPGRETREAPPVMKLADIRELQETPPLPARAASSERAVEMTAETFIEDDETRNESAAASLGGTSDGGVSGDEDPDDFLPMHLVSRLPRFSENELRRRQSYPPPARRAGIEGTVYLEIFVDRRGLVRRVSVLKEDPPGRGFGEAAVRVFERLQGSPALVNGRETAVRYRYPVRFSLD